MQNAGQMTIGKTQPVYYFFVTFFEIRNPWMVHEPPKRSNFFKRIQGSTNCRISFNLTKGGAGIYGLPYRFEFKKMLEVDRLRNRDALKL